MTQAVLFSIYINNHGTNSDGSISVDYCKYFFNYEKFLKDKTMEEMIESYIPFWINEEEGIDEKVARQKLFSIAFRCTSNQAGALFRLL